MHYLPKTGLEKWKYLLSFADVVFSLSNYAK